MDADDLLERLRGLWTRRRREVNEGFHRTLPLSEYVVDRWEKARELGFGDGSSIYDSSLVFGDVEVGSNVWIGPFTIIDGTGGMSIGDGCNISAGAHLYTHSSVRRCISGGAYEMEHEPVTIGSDVFIGANAVVNMGVTIGDRSVVAAGAVVTADVPPFTVVAGVPARPVAAVHLGAAGERPVFGPLD